MAAVAAEHVDGRMLQLHSSHRIDITGDNHPHRRGRARIDLIPHGHLIGGQMIVRRHREDGQLRSCRSG